MVPGMTRMAAPQKRLHMKFAKEGVILLLPVESLLGIVKGGWRLSAQSPKILAVFPLLVKIFKGSL